MSSSSSWIRTTSRLAIYMRDELACVWCGASYESGATLTLDHVVRREDGGTNDPANIVTSCWSCNSVPSGRPNKKADVRRQAERLARSRERNDALPALRLVAGLFEKLGAPPWVSELKRRARLRRQLVGDVVEKDLLMPAGQIKVGRRVSLRSGESYDVYVGRAGKGQDGYFGNPVLVHRMCTTCETYHATAGATLDCFERYARERGQEDPEYRRRVADLRGKTIACFCMPDAPCHGDVLMALAQEWWDEGLGSVPVHDDLVPF